MELLLCLGQETSDGLTGEIDEQALEEKRARTGRPRSLERYGFA
jgi:hypothetical protein